MSDPEKGSRGQRELLKIDGASSSLGFCGWLLVIISFILVAATAPISIWLCIKHKAENTSLKMTNGTSSKDRQDTSNFTREKTRITKDRPLEFAPSCFLGLRESLFKVTQIVKEYERAIIFRLGRILKGGAKGPGLFFVLPCTDNIIKVDMRTISFDIPPQEILTKDSVTVNVDGVVYYRVQNATLAVANITNADSATRLLAQTTLRNVLGTKNLSQILSDREEIAHSMQATLDDATDDWGIKVERVEIKDVKLPVQLQRAMAAEAEATREARAKVIAAEGEMNASRALKEASIVITESPAALQLRYLQTLTTIAAEKNSTIVFPLPIDMLQGIMAMRH